MIKTIIIEDEEDSRNVLRDMLMKHFNEVEVLAVCEDSEEGKVAIEQLDPELVFSDIELNGEPVFNMLQQLKAINFEIIFTTAFEKYALQAIKFSAIDYLLKPFSKTDLTEALEHYKKNRNKFQHEPKLDALFHNLRHFQSDLKKIALPTAHGLRIIPVKDIIRCTAEGNYTHFFLANKDQTLVTKTLKEYEDLLNEYDFIRVHHSYLINLHHLKSYSRLAGGTVTMDDGSVIEISRRKKEEFLKRLEQL